MVGHGATLSINLDQSLMIVLFKSLVNRANEELYSGICYATLCFFKAILTMEAGDLQAASHGISRLNELAARSRRKTNVFTRFLYKPNYDQYTDEEIHAELVDAESNLLLSINSFLSDQSVIVLVRGAIKIRSCYQRYKECLYILETRTQWQSQEARRHFESGVRMGLGIFNYYMSYLPLRVIKLLQYVGFTGNRAAAIEDLDKSIALNDGLRSTLSALVVLTNLTYVEHLFGISNYDIKKVEQISEILENQYPDSAYYLIFKGRYFQMLGRMDEALKIWQRSIDVQSDWIQIHTICYWEMMWCYAARLEWAKAAEYASRLSKCSKWSHASYLYMYATFLYAQLVDEERSGQITRHSQSYEERLGEISEFMKKIPSLRVRLAGKTIPAEKFAIVRSAKFLQENNRLTIPALEYFYIWNNFVYIRNCNSELERMLERVELELEHIQSCNSNISNNYNDNHSSILSTAQDHERPQVTANSNKETTIRHDDSYLMLLIKAMCLKQLRRYVEAERVFNEIIESTDSIQEDTFIVPHAAMEFALMKLKMRQFVDAQRIIKMIRNNHSGYLHEGIVHFKLHAASRVIREQLDAISGSTHSIDLDVNTSEYNCQDLNNLENELKIKNTKGT